MTQKGGVFPIILLTFLAISTIAVGYFAIQNKTFFRPQAAVVTGQKTAIRQNLGLKIKVATINNKNYIKASWEPLIKGHGSLTGATLILRNQINQEIPLGGRTKIKDYKTTQSYVFDKIPLPIRGNYSFSITLRAIYDNAKTVYYDTGVYSYNNKELQGPASNLDRPKISPFGLAGWVNINSSDPYGQFFYKSGANLKSSSVRWKDMEPKKGDGYKMDPTDPTFPKTSWIKNFIDEHDNWCRSDFPQCIFIFGEAPEWALEKAHANGITSSCAAIDEEDFEAMAMAGAEAVKRFGKNTVGLELYNEPDFANCYGGKDDTNSNGKPDYQDYATILKLLYEKVKQVDSSYPILMGRLASDPAFNQTSFLNCDDLPVGLACTSEEALASGRRINLIDFLEQILAYSNQQWGQQFFDYLDLHYYEIPHQHTNAVFHGADTYTTGGGGIRGKTFWARALMEKYGGIGKPIIYSEMGMATNEHGTNMVTPDQQAEWVFRLYAQGLSAGAESLSWYCFGDRSGPNSPCHQPGYSNRLLNGDYPSFTPRPAFIAYQTIAKELKSFSFETVDKTTNLEGYIFASDSDDLTHKEVLWSRNGSSINKIFVTRKVTLIGFDSQPKTIEDGDSNDLDKKKNFSVTVPITSPSIAVWN